MRDTDWTPSIVPGDDDRDACLVVNDFGRRGRAWCETDVKATDLETVIQDLLDGQYSKPVRVVSFNTAEGWSQDISADVAEELRRRCELEARQIPTSLAGFFARHEFANLHHQVRVKHERLLARISREHGNHTLRKIRTRTLLGWHKTWSAGGKIAMAQALVSRLRVLFRFGATLLENRECERLLDALGGIRLRKSPTRTVQMTAEQARAIRFAAHKHFGWHSIAFAQALQFELLLGQKDVIGEWVPITEAGESDVINSDLHVKWVRGLRWSDIDEHFILRHTLGKSRRHIEVDLRTAPMVMEDLRSMGLYNGPDCVPLLRHHLPSRGPMIRNDNSGLPWSTAEFRRKWRKIAKQANVPENVKNRDSNPPGIIVGGIGRARISQTITSQMMSYSYRMLRKR